MCIELEHNKSTSQVSLLALLQLRHVPELLLLTAHLQRTQGGTSNEGVLSRCALLLTFLRRRERSIADNVGRGRERLWQHCQEQIHKEAFEIA